MSGEIEATARGHLAADAVVNKTPDGSREVCEFRIGVGVRRKNPQTGVWEDVRTDWVSVSVWSERLIPAVMGLKKGQGVEVRGSLTPGSYIAKTGEAANGDRINARSVTLVPKAPAAAKAAA